MYPSQTSLIPVTVSLVKFFQINGFNSFSNNYPYWYLGSTPYRFLTGPLIPILATVFERIFSWLTLFDIITVLIVASYLASAIGWGVLVKKLLSSKGGITQTGDKLRNINNWDFRALLVVVFLLIFPWRLFTAFAFDEASFTLARNFLPWVFLAFWRVANGKSMARNKVYVARAIAILALSSLLLLNTSILPIFLVGLACLLMASSFKKGRFKDVLKRIRLSFILVSYSLILVTIYYTPGYWWAILANPSIGGASGIKVILRIFDLLRALVPLILAIFVVYLGGRIKSRLTIFAISWSLTFLFLSLFRFIGDPDFWTDWIAWFYEIEIGLATLLSRPFYIYFKSILLKERASLYPKWFVVFFILPFVASFFVFTLLGKPKLLSNSPPVAIESLGKLSELAGRKTVFLSGTGVFWANAFYDIYQVRGGRDQVAVHPTWNKAAHEFREGEDSEASKVWLEELQVAYVLIHAPDSKEYYHDFKNIGKWKDIGEVVWQEKGDLIYKFED